MAGNRLGSRVKILYESDTLNTLYILETDQDFVLAGLGVGAGSPDLFDPQNPPAAPAVVCPAPKRFEPRCVYFKAADGARKQLIAASQTANLYATSFGSEITIDGEVFTSTGRKGEKLSF